MGEGRGFARRVFGIPSQPTPTAAHDAAPDADPGSGWVAVCRRDSLHETCSRIVTVDGHELAMFVTDGNVVAVKNQCPHQDVPIDDAIIDDGCLTCTWHGWRFELSTGDHLTMFGPRRGLTTYPVQVIDEVVWVAKHPVIATRPATPSRDPSTVAVSPHYL